LSNIGRLLISHSFLFSFHFNKSNLGVYNFMCLAQNVYNTFLPTIGCDGLIYGGETSFLYLFAAKVFY
jgi:hypothetical protein